MLFFVYISDDFTEVYAPRCNCPVPCEFSILEPEFSYATISNHAVRKLITRNERQVLKSKLELASETTSRMDKTKLKDFKILVDNVADRFNKIQRLVGHVSNYLQNQTSEFSNILNETTSAYIEKERLYRFQDYIVERNFLRGREAMEERTLRNVALGFAEFAMLNARRIRRLATIPVEESTSRRDLYELIMDSLKVRQEVVGLARDNITHLYNAFLNGTKIFSYQFEDINISHTDYIVPKNLLNESMFHNWYVRLHIPKLFNDFDLIETALGMFMDEASAAYVNLTLNETSLNNTFEEYLFSCRTYMFSKSVFYSQGIERPIIIINERQREFDKHWNEFTSESDEIDQNLKALIFGLENMQTISIPKLTLFMNKLVDYISNKNKSLMVLADEIMSDEIQTILSSINDFFREVETRGQAIYDLWTLLIDPIKSIWTMILNDKDMIEYYQFTNNSRFLQNVSEVICKYRHACSGVRDNLDVRDLIQNYDEDFFLAMTDISSYLSDFKSSIRVDHSFLR